MHISKRLYAFTLKQARWKSDVHCANEVFSYAGKQTIILFTLKEDVFFMLGNHYSFLVWIDFY